MLLEGLQGCRSPEESLWPSCAALLSATHRPEAGAPLLIGQGEDSFVCTVPSPPGGTAGRASLCLPPCLPQLAPLLEGKHPEVHHWGGWML